MSSPTNPHNGPTPTAMATATMWPVKTPTSSPTTPTSGPMLMEMATVITATAKTGMSSPKNQPNGPTPTETATATIPRVSSLTVAPPSMRSQALTGTDAPIAISTAIPTLMRIGRWTTALMPCQATHRSGWTATAMATVMQGAVKARMHARGNLERPPKRSALTPTARRVTRACLHWDVLTRMAMATLTEPNPPSWTLTPTNILTGMATVLVPMLITMTPGVSFKPSRITV